MQRHHDRNDGDEKPEKHGAMKTQNSILSLNKMSFDAPVSSSNSTDRVQINQMFQPQSYQQCNSSTIAQVVFNTGSAMINAATSTVQFDVSFNGIVDDDIAWSFGCNFTQAAAVGPPARAAFVANPKSGSSACNLFTSLDCKARGGEFPVRSIDTNIYCAAVSGFKKGYGSELLYGASGGASYNAKTQKTEFPLFWAKDTVATFEIPLSKLCPGSFFSENSPMLPQLISGLTLYLRFANLKQAFCFYKMNGVNPGDGSRPLWADVAPQDAVNVAAFSYNVQNMQLLLDTMQIFDSSLALINAKSSSLSSSGCQFPYYGIWQNKTTLVTQTATIDLMCSASQLSKLILCFNKPLSGAVVNADAMARLPLTDYTGANGGGIFIGDVNSTGRVGGASSAIRLRLGANYLQMSPVNNAGQLYRGTYQALTDIRGGLAGAIDPLNCESHPIDLGVGYNDWAAYGGTGGTTIAFDINKSALLALSGGQSNNARSLLLELYNVAAGAGAAAVELTVFCIMCKVCNVSNENCIIDT